MSLDASWTGLFPEDAIPVILRVVQRCASGLKKRAACESENSLSDRLYRRIRRDQEYRVRVPAELKREGAVYRDDGPAEEDHEPAKPGPIGRVDFVFTHGGGTGLEKPYPEFVIEAKRLHVTFPKGGWHSLVPQYVTGDQGMMCFVSGRYSSTQRAAAMLGYVFDDDAPKAMAAIATAIEKDREKLRLKKGTRCVKTSLPALQAQETLHALAGREFRLFHLLAKV
jgi:hypothetical protein